MLKEFRDFAVRGNVMDMAVGVIIGGAFGKIVSSLVGDILMPPIGLLISKVNFANLCFDLHTRRLSNLDAAKAAGAPTINFGAFINTVLDFVIVAFVIFLMVKLVQRLKDQALLAAKPAPAPAAPAAPAPRACPYCCQPVAPQAVRCPHCTSTLASSAAGG